MNKIKKWFVLLLSVSVLFLALSQVMLLNDNIKDKISYIYQIESKYVYSEQQIPKGNIEIEISHPEKGIYLLQNGEPVAELDQKIFSVNVFDNTVLEIDGRNCSHEFIVKIKNVTENVGGYYEQKIVVDKNIVILGRFFIK